MDPSSPHAVSGHDPRGPTAELAALRETVDDLQRRVTALESGTEAAASAEPEPAAAAWDGALPKSGVSGARVMSLVGRALIILAGAFLLRALTDRGALPPAAGVGLGLAYALALLALARRCAGRGDGLGAHAYGLTALVVAIPLVWEVTATLRLVSPFTGTIALAGITAAAFTVAWRHRLRPLYWAFALAATATATALLAATGAAVLCVGFLLVLGTTTLLFAYGRGWGLVRWPVALVADFIVLRLVIMSGNPDGALAGGRPVAAETIQGLALALMLAYLGPFMYRALIQGRGVRAFDVVQSALAIAVGFGGAAHVARTSGSGAEVLGWAALVGALAGYAVSFTVVRQRLGRGRAFFYFASLAMLFLVLGSGLVASGAWLAWVWIALGLAAALLGMHYDRVTLRAHSAVYLILAASRTGLFAAVGDAFGGDPGRPWTTLGTSALVALAATAGCYVLLARTEGATTKARRTPRFVVAILALAGLGYLAVTLLLRLVTDAPPDASPAGLAVVRTAVLAFMAVGLAWAGRRPRFAELGWLVYPILLAGGVKLVVEDLPRGTPMSLTVGFALFGMALVAAPAILRRGRRRAPQAPAGSSAESSLT